MGWRRLVGRSRQRPTQQGAVRLRMAGRWGAPTAGRGKPPAKKHAHVHARTCTHAVPTTHTPALPPLRPPTNHFEPTGSFNKPRGPLGSCPTPGTDSLSSACPPPSRAPSTHTHCLMHTSASPGRPHLLLCTEMRTRCLRVASPSTRMMRLRPSHSSRSRGSPSRPSTRRIRLDPSSSTSRDARCERQVMPVTCAATRGNEATTTTTTTRKGPKGGALKP